MTERIPLFPLGTVLYPGLLLPLHIFEERYRALVRDLVALPADEPRRFGVVAIREGREVGADGVTALHEVGCTAELRRVEAYDDGRYDLVTTGATRFRLAALHDDRPYLTGDVEPLTEDAGDAPPVLARSVARRFARYRARLLSVNGREPGDPVELPGEPRLLSYLVAAAMVLDLADKQALLAAATTADRLRLGLSLLRRESVVLGRLPSLPAVDLVRSPYGLN